MEKLYADVIVDISHEKLDRPFVYRVPESLREQLVPGSSVRIPFGRGGKIIRGYVVAFRDECGYDESLIKEISAADTGGETSDGRLVALAAWMSRYYGSTLIAALKTVVPVRRKVSAVTEKTLQIADESAASEYLALCGRKNWKARGRALRVIIYENERSVPKVCEKAKVSLQVLKELEAQGIISVSENELYRKMVKDAEVFPADRLTEEQERAVSLIRREWREEGRPVLLSGVTGSGKTVVYTELVADALSEGKQAIVLIPEIALTRQTVLRFVRRFGSGVSFLHSRLSHGERYDQMKAAKSGDIQVMVGPRSALFTPFPNLGLIIIDEEHEDTYRSEISPRYHARETAVKRAELEGARVLMGSATPSIASAASVEKGEYFGVELTGRFGESVLPETAVVDMREELKAGNRSILSSLLYEKLSRTLENGDQAMLFLNRRGHTGFITCRSCGAVLKCPHCDVSLTLHRNGKLICHYCGYERENVSSCPVCGSHYIGGFTIGTEQVEEILGREFPQAGILRMDADTTKGKEGHGRILEDFSDGRADILIGTQMIVKGHDFPNVTLVGMLLADLSLSENDYRSSERTYDLIAQAVGRAGRGRKRGFAVIQTYHPEHFAVTAGAAQDYRTFYREEMAFRKLLSYPPCGAMAAVLGSAKDEAALTEAMFYIRKLIDRIDPKGRLSAIGPAPQSVGKLKDYYRQVIYIRNRDRKVLVAAKDRIETYVAANHGFDDIRISIDFNV